MEQKQMNLLKLFFLFVLFFAMGTVNATASTAANAMVQNDEQTVSGQVLDEFGEPIIGATVRLKGAQAIAVTDVDGNFSIKAPKGGILVISYLGYADKEVVVDGTQLKVSMAEDAVGLNEVVVTALGIRKEAKALSYNVQQIGANEITGVKDANFMNALAGKVAGVEINASASGVGGGVKVVMRGAKSIAGNNNALYVIDGIPMPSLSSTQPNDAYTGQAQTGDAASMINSDDIESISVLSGAAASALYGSDAANGVIMITTKKGQTGQARLTYSNNTSFFTPFVTPEFQNTYGRSTGYYSWGEKLATPSSYDPLDFFNIGFNIGNSITLSTGSENSQTFVSMASTNAEGIVENNKLNRYNFAVRNTTNFLNDRLHMDLSAMYMNVMEQNMLSQGYYANPLVPLYLFPAGDDINKYMAFEHYDAERNFKTQFWPYGNLGLAVQNPYWIVNRNRFENHKDRFVLSGGLTYDLAEGITLAGRAKVDNTASVFEKKYAASSDPLFAGQYGAYHKADEHTRQIYADAILHIDKYFGDFSVDANFGASMKDVDYSYSTYGGFLNTVANHFSLLNVAKSTAEVGQLRYHDNTQSLFATAQIGWKSMIYLDATARNDWSSALGNTHYKDNGFFYPSAGLSFILTDIMPFIKGKALSFLKIRGSYSEVGNAPERFKSKLYYEYENGQPSITSLYPNRNLKPERTKAWEGGLQANLWGDKINLSVSVYKTRTFNQYFEPQLSATAGYLYYPINAGRVDNKGIEATLGIHQALGPVDWRSNFTYTLNRNKIKKLLAPTMTELGEEVSMSSMDVLNLGMVKQTLVEGGSIGDIYVTKLITDEHGYVAVDYTSRQVKGIDQGNYVYAGNVSPKYNMSWRNSFSWKGITLSALVSARIGGRGVSITQGYMDAYGSSKATAVARDNGGATVNGALIPAQGFYQIVGPSVGCYYVYSLTNVRLGELSVGYDIPITKVVPWIQGLNVAFTGRNLIMFYNKAPFDPEVTASTGTYFSGIDNFMMPSMRNLGFSVKVQF